MKGITKTRKEYHRPSMQLYMVGGAQLLVGSTEDPNEQGSPWD